MESASEIKSLALSLGFSACGVARAESIGPSHADAFRTWLREGRNGDMQYMENHADLRMDPQRLLEGAQSVIVVALGYYPQVRLNDKQLQFAYYAYGQDYHEVMRERLKRLAEVWELRASSAGTDAGTLFRPCCDTAPMLERYWAWQAGIGWIGKHKNVILPGQGSYFFLGELLTTLRFDHYDEPVPDRCGTCTRCLQACPTKALQQDGERITFDARRCLSYLTIENRGDIPTEAAEAMGSCIYGCDRCQQACPHNRHAQPTEVEEFRPSDEFLAMQPEDWEQLTPEQYRRLFRCSAVKRAKFEGLSRNIRAALHTSAEPSSDSSSEPSSEASSEASSTNNGQ